MPFSLIFIFLCSSFLAGITAASFFKISLFAGFFILISGLALIGVLWKFPKPAVAGFCLIFFVFGAFRFQFFELGILKQRESSELQDQKVILIGKVVFEPDKRQSYTNLKIRAEEVFLLGKEQYALDELKGVIVWTTVQNYPEFFYNDLLKLEGKMQIPSSDNGFNWPGYLAKEGASWQMSWPQAQLLERTPPKPGWPWIYSKILSLKNGMKRIIYENFPSSEGALLSGLIFGDRSLMSNEFKEKMSRTGLSHIAAVSGANVIILSSILMVFFVGLGMWRQQAFWMVLFFVWVFVILVGLPASGLRAGIMASLLLLAQYLGRQNEAWRAMILAAAVMLCFNPLLFKYDIGFQLSFLAAGGLVFLSPVIKEKMNFIPEQKIFNIKEILSQTLAAQAATLPVLIYNFGYVSLIAPLSNILIVPMIPLIMALGFIVILGGSIWHFLGWILSWPCLFLLAFAIKIIDICASAPFASFALKAPLLWLAAFYVFLLFLIFKRKRKEKNLI